MASNTIKLETFENIFNYLLDNNKNLVDQNKLPIAIGICGEAGCGKTSIIRSIAKQRNMTFCKLNLAQIDELGD